MNIEIVKDYALHFLQSAVDFLSGTWGVVILGVAVCLFVVYLFEDLRR